MVRFSLSQQANPFNDIIAIIRFEVQSWLS